MPDLPESWTHDELQSVALVVTGGTPPTSDDSLYGHDHLFVSPSDLGSWKWVDRSEKMISEKGWRRVRRVPHGASLFVCIGSTIGKVGMAASDLCTNQQINAAIPNKEVCPDFLYYALCASAEAVKEQAGEQAVPIVNKSEFSKLKLHLPPLPEQHAIAEALTDADGVIAGLERLVAKKRQIKQGAMQDLLTARRRLPGFSGEWEECRLGRICSFAKGRGLPKAEVLRSGDFPCIHYGSLFREQPTVITKLTTFANGFHGSLLSKVGDVLMPTSDVTPDGLATASCIEISGVILGGDILVIRPETGLLDGRFLAALIRSSKKQIMELISGTTVFHIYASDMQKFQFRLPSLAEQTAIAAILSDMDAEIQALDARLTKARAVKEGMMQVLLTGRVRLV